jgi:ribosomal protein S12 methylthiotransferase
VPFEHLAQIQENRRLAGFFDSIVNRNELTLGFQRMNTPNIALISLGCPKALVDTEVILTQLYQLGYRTVDQYEEADLVLINTCGFINEAIDESSYAIEEALAQHGRVIVTGCLGAKKSALKKRYPELLAVTGPAEYEAVVEAIKAHLPPADEPIAMALPQSGIKLTPRHYAYLKISEGCSHRCRFCIIPALRGALRSRPLPDILDEAAHLVEDGVRELIVVAQDTVAYGSDIAYPQASWNGKALKTEVITLAEQLSQLGVWVRLHYLYPYPQIDALVALMAEGKILPYLDIPFQHASPAILRAMRRPGTQESLLENIARWRKKVPELVIRSTFIVGFPTESESDFETLLNFVAEARMNRVGAFKYSPVEGAAANQLPDHIDEEEKEDRLQRFMALQAQISRELLAERVGKIETVRIDEVTEEGVLIARSQAEAPEIDGVIYVEPSEGVPSDTFDAATLQAGDEIEVEIIDNDQHDLWAKLIG